MNEREWRVYKAAPALAVGLSFLLASVKFILTGYDATACQFGLCAKIVTVGMAWWDIALILCGGILLLYYGLEKATTGP